ncbi:MAG: SDR family oxidoreductase [Chloroflexi bacterium]|nr:SDR family oxidoreductase [Chloroflexota bacterium]
MILENKTAIITGGSSGIGKAIAGAFAKEGAQLVLNSRTESDLEATCQEIGEFANNRVEAYPANVSNPEEAKALVDFTLSKLGTVDILVNCAGIYGPIGLATDIDVEKWVETININLIGTFLCIRGVLPTMIKHKKGKIVNFSGGGAGPLPRFSAYSTSKMAVVRLTENIAQEVMEYHIDVNAIAPGAVNTRLLDQVLAAGEAAGKEFLAKSKKQKEDGGTPPQQVAELAVFLASHESDGITGKLISLLWDKWREFPLHLNDINSSDVLTLRRTVPEDRGFKW